VVCPCNCNTGFREGKYLVAEHLKGLCERQRRHHGADRRHHDIASNRRAE
jgi:hypothetical protein